MRAYKLQPWVRTRSAVTPSREDNRAGLPQTARSVMASYASRVAARMQYSRGQERTCEDIQYAPASDSTCCDVHSGSRSHDWRCTRSDCDATPAGVCTVDVARERVCRDVEHDANLPRTVDA